MSNDVTYNQIISINNDSIISHNVKRTFAEKSKLTLILDDSKKIIIDGKMVDVIGHKKRIRELVLKAKEHGYNLPMKSVVHYAKGKSRNDIVEYILIRW